MSKWEELDIENKLVDILRHAEGHPNDHHFTPPFLTAYQLAIAFYQHYPEDVEIMAYEIGGKDTGTRKSLAQYLARELSTRIKARSIQTIDGGFLSNQHLEDISFDTGEKIITSSLTESQSPLSMFRLARE